jgi:hypothetical protein
MCAMSDGSDRPTGDSHDGDGPGVLANLPRTRPQRASPRRAAAREAARASSEPKRANAGKRAAPRRAKQAADNGAGEGGAARAATAGGGRAGSAAGQQPAARRGKRTAGKRTAGTRRRPTRSVPMLDPVPRQGYEAEDDAATRPVQPPGGAELLISAAEIVGELAKAGLSRSERLVKDALSRLPLS